MKNIKRLIRGKEQGLSLIEVLVAIVILGILSASVLSIGNMVSKTSQNVDTQQGARNLAELQMEFTKKQPFASSYGLINTISIATEFPGYRIETPIGVSSIPTRDGNIQKITVRVFYKNETNPSITLEDYKVMR